MANVTICPVCKSTNCARDWPSAFWFLVAWCLPPVSWIVFRLHPNRWCVHCGARFRRDSNGAFEPPRP